MAPVCVVDVLEDRRDLNGQKCTIELAAGSYLLIDGAGTPVAECANPDRLSSWAFELGAFEVRHNYNGAANCTKTTPAPMATYHEGGRQVGTKTERTGEVVELWKCADCGREWQA